MLALFFLLLLLLDIDATRSRNDLFLFFIIPFLVFCANQEKRVEKGLPLSSSSSSERRDTAVEREKWVSRCCPPPSAWCGFGGRKNNSQSNRAAAGMTRIVTLQFRVLPFANNGSMDPLLVRPCSYPFYVGGLILDFFFVLFVCYVLVWWGDFITFAHSPSS